MSDAGSVPSDNDTRKSKSLRPLRELLGFLWPHNQSEEGLRRAVLFMVGVGFAMACGSFIRFYMVSWLGERVSADLRRDVFNNLLTVHPGFYEKNHAGEIMSRITTDTTLLQTLIGSSVSLAARNALTLVGALILMSLTNIKR